MKKDYKDLIEALAAYFVFTLFFPFMFLVLLICTAPVLICTWLFDKKMLRDYITAINKIL